ncbi:MAG TPA: hypothetical protein VKA46_33215 [Gemmataceae bacterium]|nr:hypothetical protein [Gemmataceae bacterium]
MRRLRLASLLLLPCLSLVSGCTEAVSFNDTMVQLTQDLERAGRKFGERLIQHEGKRDPLDDDYADVVGEVGKIVKRAKAVQVPNLTGAKAYHEAFLEYMEFEEDAVDREFRKLVSAASRRDRESLMTNLERLNKLELKEVAKLKAAQKAFAQANNVTVRD